LSELSQAHVTYVRSIACSC